MAQNTPSRLVVLFFGICITTFAINSSQALESRDALKQIFQKHIQKPVVEFAFTEVTNDYLRTGPDGQMATTLDRNPVLREIRPLLVQSVQRGIESGIARGASSMTPIEAQDTNPALKRLYNEMTTAAGTLGFTEEQIKNARFYLADGPVNAYTFSAFKDHLTFVVYTSLDQAADAIQLRGVIMHEMGHILSGHVLQNVQNVAMILQLARIFLGNSPVGNGDVEELRYADLAKLPEPVRDFWETALTQSHMGMNTGSSQLDQMNAARRDGFMQAVGIALKALKNANDDHSRDNQLPKSNDAMAEANLQMALTFGKGLSPDQASALLRTYLQNMIMVLERMEIPLETINYLRDRDMELARAVDRHHPVPRLDPEEFFYNMMVANAALSREQETSADLHAGIDRRPDWISSFFEVFSGAPLEKLKMDGNKNKESDKAKSSVGTYRARIKEIREMANKYERALSEIYATRDEDDRRELFGADPRVDHPFTNVRALKFFDYSNRIEMVSLRNEFMKLIVTDEKLIEIANGRLEDAQEIENEIKQFGDKMNDRQKQSALAAAKKAATQGEEATQAAEELASDILNLLNSRSLEGYNSYFEDMIDLRLAQKQRSNKVADLIKTSLKEETDADVAKQQNRMLERLKSEAAYQSPVMEALFDLIKKEAGKRSESTELKRKLSLVTLALNPEAGLKEIIEARADIDKRNEFRKPYETIEQDLQVTEMNSSLLGKFKTLEELEAQTQSKVNPKRAGKPERKSAPDTKKSELVSEKKGVRCRSILALMSPQPRQ